MDVQTCRNDTPDRIYRVSLTQLSIARHCGSIRYNGAIYWYDQAADTLTRDDVIKREQLAAKQLQRLHRETAPYLRELAIATGRN